MRAYERLLKYVKYHTASCEESESVPSTDRQFTLANALAEELTELGCTEVTVDGRCYVYAKLPATAGLEGAARLGFIAHLDTAPDFSGEGVSPVVIENYDGGELMLGDSGRVLSPKMFPHLSGLAGRTLITTDGNTLLGADDKAGIAEIMTLIELIKEGNVPHGQLSFAFTPDEEIGRGADCFDIEKFGADFAFTVDGGAEGSLEYENFNAASARFDIKGVNVHPGSAKNTMINASLVAMEINSCLPACDTPTHTEGYEGFYYLTRVQGECESASLSYIVRDHDAQLFEARLATLRHIEKTMKEKYGEERITLTVKEQYRNMKEKILPVMHLIDNAIKATELAGVTPSVEPIRGGTDGARLSFMGLPCPNLGTGGYAFHGPYEHISAEGMDSVCKILLGLVGIYSEKK